MNLNLLISAVQDVSSERKNHDVSLQLHCRNVYFPVLHRFSGAVFLFGLMICLAAGHVVDRTEEHIAALRTKRMVGGLLTPGYVPWQALVYLSDSKLDGGIGGGALIAPQWILTAGRNLFVRKTQNSTRGKEPLIPKVYLGVVQRSRADAAAEVAVEKVFLHPAFQNASDVDNDLALIKLKEPVSYNDMIFPIPLPEKGDNLEESEEQKGVIAGWGWGPLFTFSDRLKFLVLPILPSNADHDKITTTRTKFQENVCYGDAGGALALLNPDTKKVYAAGILSYDEPCTRDEEAVFIKVSAYLPWIHSVMSGDSERFSSLRNSTMNNLLSKFL
ncbi:haptoglobin isoform X2 [Hemibagrus wyckioides]|uniref:haptoglobin isoform X2 n=1 Tax=Hemibagrus wyckioides TaxID=337641 RepID=UPI00266BCECC|nr:haptoglobin isoform X2 [Hemibagrus wyckioides]